MNSVQITIKSNYDPNLLLSCEEVDDGLWEIKLSNADTGQHINKYVSPYIGSAINYVLSLAGIQDGE